MIACLKLQLQTHLSSPVNDAFQEVLIHIWLGQVA
jgi:hypothetical protein